MTNTTSFIKPLKMKKKKEETAEPNSDEGFESSPEKVGVSELSLSNSGILFGLFIFNICFTG